MPNNTDTNETNAYNEVQPQDGGENVYNVCSENADGAEKKVHVPSMVLMIIGAVFAPLFTYVTYVCSIVSLVISIQKRRTHKTTYAIVINIIALAVAVANSVLGIMLYTGYITLPQ